MVGRCQCNRVSAPNAVKWKAQRRQLWGTGLQKVDMQKSAVFAHTRSRLHSKAVMLNAIMHDHSGLHGCYMLSASLSCLPVSARHRYAQVLQQGI